MDGGEDVILDDLLRDQDSVFEVIAVPRHERDQYVTTQRDLAALSARTVGQNLALLHGFTLGNQDFLVNAGGRVGPHELAHRINPDAVLGRML